jgi:peptidoglycan/xylan/chitin deacetylase (PgdA/CDA1 family)
MPAGFIKRYLLPLPASLAGLERLIRLADEPLVHVFYHTVSDDYLPHVSPLYRPKNIREFKADMDFLLKHFRPVSLNDVLRHVQKEKILSAPSFHLSFDDGLKEIYEVVFPVLWQKGIPATLFVNSDFVDNKDLFFRYKAAVLTDRMTQRPVSPPLTDSIRKRLMASGIKKASVQSMLLHVNYGNCTVLDEIAAALDLDFSAFLREKRPCLTSGELKTMQQSGFSIGGHSINHPNYFLLPEEEQVRQTLASCSFVQKHFPEPHTCFAFPFSDEGVKPSFFKSIYGAVDLTFAASGINTAFQGRHRGRIDMETYGKNAKQCIYRAYMTNVLKKYRFHSPLSASDSTGAF